MLSVDRNPDEFKHMRRRPDFLLVYLKWKFRLSWTNVVLDVSDDQPMSVYILQVY